MQLDLYTSAFCEPCHRTRAVVAEASALVDALEVTEKDVAAHAAEAEQLGIRSTPTTIVRRTDGTEVLRAEGVPTLTRLLTALARAVD